MMFGCLHTVPALAAGFDTLIHDRVPEAEIVHIADAWLLQTAITTGITEQVHERVLAHVRHLQQRGADAVLVTCSSLGEVAEEADRQVPIPVVRIDTAMAREAVTTYGTGPHRVVALATLTSTLDPTARLLRREAGDTGVVVEARLVERAADAKAHGDGDTHDRLVRDAVDAALTEAEVVVLAQASMADAYGPTTPDRVLTSPAGGVAALLRAVPDDRST